MEDAGLADQVLGVVGEKVPLSRHHRRCDRAFVAPDDRVHPERQAIASVIDRRVEALPESRIARRGQRPDRPQRRADRADPGEIRIAGKIVSARQRRPRGREQARLEFDVVARRDIGRGAGRHPHPAGNLALRHAVGAGDADHHARADRPQVHFLDIALQRDDADAVEHRRRDPGRAQRHRQETREQSRDGERGAESERPATGNPRERPKERGHQRRQPHGGLAVGGQIERDPAHRRDRNPQEEAPLLDLARERP